MLSIHIYVEYYIIGGETMKNIKRFLVATLLIGVLSMSTILCACNTDDTPPCDLVLTQFYLKDQNPYMSDYFDDETKLNLAEKITSVEELKSFCQEKQLKVFDETDTSLKYDRVSKQLNEYDEEFFKNYSIVLIFRFKETTDNYVYDSSDIKDGVMTVNLITANGNTTTNVTTQIRILEISKKTAKKINQIQVKERLGELDQKIDIRIYQGWFFTSSNCSAVISSKEEITNFCDKYVLNDDKFIIDLFSKLYNDEFFQNKSIVVLSRFRTSSGYFFRVKDFEINENSLNITLSRKLPDEPVDYPCDIATCLYLLEIEKDQVANITQINVNEIVE